MDLQNKQLIRWLSEYYRPGVYSDLLVFPEENRLDWEPKLTNSYIYHYKACFIGGHNRY